MEPKLICQSCTMPIDNAEDRGTEKDGSKNNEYCKYCYQNGAFVRPEMKMEEMKTFLSTQTEKMNLPEEVVQHSLAILPFLKRWKKVKA